MSRPLGSDPVTGLSEYFDYDEAADIITVRAEQDVTPFLEYAKKLRAEKDIAKRGIKENWWEYAIIPPVVQLEMRNKGIDFLNPGHAKRVFDEINENYPALKLSDMHHALKKDGS
jgi:hypothetical protein